MPNLEAVSSSTFGIVVNSPGSPLALIGASLVSRPKNFLARGLRVRGSAPHPNPYLTNPTPLEVVPLLIGTVRGNLCVSSAAGERIHDSRAVSRRTSSRLLTG